MISFPVDVRSAVSSEQEVSLNILCANGHDPQRIKQPRVCPACGDLTDPTAFVKGREEGGRIVVLDQDAIDALAPGDDVTKVMTFTVHPTIDVDRLTLPSGSVYYLAGGPGAIAYGAVRDALLSNPGYALLTTWAPRSTVSLWRLTVVNDALAVKQCAWPSSVEGAPSLPVLSKQHDQLVTQVGAAFEAWALPLEPDTYRNDRAEALQAMLATAESTVLPRVALKVVGDDTSLLDALTASLAAVKKRPAARKPRARKEVA